MRKLSCPWWKVSKSHSLQGKEILSVGLASGMDDIQLAYVCITRSLQYRWSANLTTKVVSANPYQKQRTKLIFLVIYLNFLFDKAVSIHFIYSLPIGVVIEMLFIYRLTRFCISKSHLPHLILCISIKKCTRPIHNLHPKCVCIWDYTHLIVRGLSEPSFCNHKLIKATTYEIIADNTTKHTYLVHLTS